MQSSMAQYRSQLVRLGGQKTTMSEQSGLYRPQLHSQNTISRQQQQQQQQHSATLTYGPALAKLKLEADKIRKWKTATQFELKKKDGQLTETREALERVQEEVTRVRVREETLKTQLQDQVSSQTELQHKILVTRGLCSTLKEKVERIEVTLDIGRNDHAHNKDLDNQRLEQYKALADQYKELDRETERGQRSLKEALANERERGHGLELELTNEIARSCNLASETERLQQLVETLSQENEEAKRRRREEEERAEREKKMKEDVEELCRQLQEQLRVAVEESHSHQQNILSLTDQISVQEAQHKNTVDHLEEVVKEEEKKCQSLEDELKELQSAIETQENQILLMTREREDLETSLTAVREQLCSVEYSRRDDVTRLMKEMTEKEEAHNLAIRNLSSQLLAMESSLSSIQTQLKESENVCVTRQQENDKLNQSLTHQERVSDEMKTEIERLAEGLRVMERERDEREKERDQARSNATTLSAQLDEIKTNMMNDEKKRVETVLKMDREKDGLTNQLSETSRRLSEKEEEITSLMSQLQSEKKSRLEETGRLREEAERARETQAREKEGFDTQVTELCGMLEKYRDENQKIVNQKDIQIQSIQQSLTQSREKQEEMEEVVKQGQEEVTRLGEELTRLQTEISQREEEVRVHEAQVREKDEEMAELLKAVDTLRRKQQSSSSSIPQSTTRTPLHTPLHTPLRTPTLFTTPRTSMTHMAPPRTTPLSHRPPLKKPRQEDNERDEDEEEEETNTYRPTESEDVLFRKPHPLPRFRPPKPTETPRPSGTPRLSGTSRTVSSGDHCSSSVGEVSSTAYSTTGTSRKRLSTSNNNRGRGTKTGGGRERGRGGKKQAAGTAWFDLDAVFGLGPED